MPTNWKKYKLGDIVDQERGISYGVVQPGKHDPNGVPILKVNNLTNKTFDINNLHFISSSIEKKHQKTRLRGGELLLSLVGTLGEVYHVPEEMKGLNVVRALAVIPVMDDFSPKWVEYWLKAPFAQNLLEQIATTSVQATINLKELREIEISFPDKNERESIATILSALDDKIELNLQMNKTLEEMAMTLYKHWFVDFGPFQNGEFVDSELGKIPKGWEVKGILDLTKLLSGGTPKTKIPEYWNGDIDWVSAKDIGNGGVIYINETEKTITEYGVNNSSTKILPEDTVILVARGSVGKYGMITKPMAMNQSCYGLFTKSEFSQGLVYLMFSKLIEQFQRMAYGSVFDTITTSTFNSTKVISPPIEIVNQLKDIIDPMFLKLKKNTIENQTLTKLRDTLLPKLISGEVRVKDIEKTVAEVL